MKSGFVVGLTLAGCAAILAGRASAEMVLSQVIVDLQPGKPAREDVEVWNDGEARMYVAAEPFEIRDPGGPGEQRLVADDPQASGILVSPRRLVLEPGERRIVRIAAIGDRSAVDRVYRVAIKPVAGKVSASGSALNVLVGYDTLVLVRPDVLHGDVVGQRDGTTLILHNESNTAQELFAGKQCDETGQRCHALPAKRLYAGATWQQTLPFATPVTYKSTNGASVSDRKF
jgi:P pilus assembly chaperone PapD